MEGIFIFIGQSTIAKDGTARSIIKILSWIFLLSAVLTSSISTPLESWLVLHLPPSLRWIGVVAGPILLLLLIWTHRSLGRCWSTTVELKDDHTLVTAGPYRWVRHPMYSVGASILVSFFLTTGNGLILLSFACIVVMISMRIGREEEMLIQEFGKEYQEYMTSTGRFLPKLLR